MKKKPIVTDQMRCNYAEKIIFRLLMQKLITPDEFKEITIRLNDIYRVKEVPLESNETDS